MLLSAKKKGLITFVSNLCFSYGAVTETCSEQSERNSERRKFTDRSERLHKINGVSRLYATQ